MLPHVISAANALYTPVDAAAFRPASKKEKETTVTGYAARLVPPSSRSGRGTS